MKKHISIALLFILIFSFSFSSCHDEPERTTTDESASENINESTSEDISEDTSEDISGGDMTATPQTTEYLSEPLTSEPADETEENVPAINTTSNQNKNDDNKDDDKKENKTYTGREPMPLADFSKFDPRNTKNLPTKKIEHAYGVAKDEKPHQISVDNQRFFDKKGYDALALDTKTKEKILYLTFDCGYENGNTGKILDALKTKSVKAAFFCTLPQMKENPDLIARMINEGHIVGNHSNRHPSFAEVDRTRMAKELQEFDDHLRANFGYTAPVFRFPMGEYSESALDLVESLGFKSIFWSVAYSDWDTNNQKGKDYAFTTVTSRLHPGAVILLHSVSSDNAAAIGDIIDWAENKGYEFRELL